MKKKHSGIISSNNVDSGKMHAAVFQSAAATDTLPLRGKNGAQKKRKTTARTLIPKAVQARVIPVQTSAINKKKLKRELRDWAFAALIVFAVAVLLRIFVADAAAVNRNSMLPTLDAGDRIVLSKLSYVFSKPAQNDIVVFRAADEDADYIARVIATSGQFVRIVNYQVYVDGKLLDEPYTLGNTSGDFYGTVPEDCVFVMGDDRELSRDSRDPSIGFVHIDELKGKVAYILWPVDKIGNVK